MPARIFISTAGDNANNGETAGAPVATFREAVIKVDDGGTIEIIDSNTHSPSNNFDNRVVVNKSVDIVASSGETPTLDGAAAHSANLPGFNMGATCTLTFTGITFQNWGAGATSYLVNQGNNITLQYSQCTFKDIGIHIFHDPPTATSGTPNKLDRCRVERTSTKKLFNSPPGGDWHFLIQNSVLHYAGTDSNQVYIDAENNNHVNGIVRNCSLLVEVNDAVGTTNGVIRCGTIENVIIRNAATVGSFSTLAALKAKGGYSNNCIFGNFAVGEVNTGASTTGLVTSDPLFVNEGASPPDLQLQAGSPCIGAGKTIAAVTVDFAGTSRSAPYDIGAFVFTSGGGGGGTSFTSNDGEETYGIKFSSSFTIRGTANKLVTRKFNSDKDNRQAPYFLTTPGPPTIRERNTPYKNET